MLARSAAEQQPGRALRVAVVGSPNVGKSTLFTRLTGRVAHIANWPGTTVERREGVLELGGRTVVLVDTPGVYSLGGVTEEERVTRDYLLRGDWDAVLVLVDAVAPEKTLYMALHVRELTGRVVVALTKWDEAHAKGVHVHVDLLERMLGVPVIPVSAVTGEGLAELRRSLAKVLESGGSEPLVVDYGVLERAISDLSRDLGNLKVGLRAPPRWLAVKLLEGDELAAKAVLEAGGAGILEKVERLRRELQSSGVDAEEAAIAARFRFVDSLCRRAVVRLLLRERQGRVERLLLHPLAGPPVSLAILLSLFAAVFVANTGFPLTLILEALGFPELAAELESRTLAGLVSSAFDSLSEGLSQALEAAGIGGLPADLLLSGVLPGVSLVLTFFPLILTALFVLAFLEDSGVGPYAAVSLHNALRRIGLSGRAIYPMLISLGCNVPGILSSRASTDSSERYQLIFSTPLIPCQARLVLLLAFAVAYFGGGIQALAAIAAGYAVSFLLFSLTSLLARRLRGYREPPELLLELPPVHRPSLKVLWWITWDYAKHFLKRAGVIILGLSTLLWVLTSYGPEGPSASPADSFAGVLGKLLSPIMLLFGVQGSAAEALAFAAVAGLLAKEAVLLAIAGYAGAAEPLEALLSLTLTKAQAFALMVFYSTYMPCLATLSAVYSEARSWKLTLAALAWSLAVSLLAGLLAYVLGSALF